MEEGDEHELEVHGRGELEATSTEEEEVGRGEDLDTTI
jgi:hypothetical protein